MRSNGPRVLGAIKRSPLGNVGCVMDDKGVNKSYEEVRTCFWIC